jgi:hypothetical protein
MKREFLTIKQKNNEQKDQTTTKPVQSAKR